jgi:hexosaminidase
VERFVQDVIGELTALTPGEYLHVGGDEAHATQFDDYQAFINLLQGTVKETGKTLIGWQEILKAGGLAPSAIAQYWNHNEPMELPRENRLILSPANRAYLDMKYHDGFPLGLQWAGFISADDAYTWDPATLLPGMNQDLVFGVEAALWTETLRPFEDLSQMMFPRLACIAELAWTLGQRSEWSKFQQRLKQHLALLEAWGVQLPDHIRPD